MPLLWTEISISLKSLHFLTFSANVVNAKFEQRNIHGKLRNEKRHGKVCGNPVICLYRLVICPMSSPRQALERCKEQEDIIESLAAPLEELREQAHADFENVSNLYYGKILQCPMTSRSLAAATRVFLLMSCFIN